jgi:septum formation protein
VIGFDSAGYFNGQILEKLEFREGAFSRLKSLSGKNHQFYTGICMINTNSNASLSKVVKTDIFMRNYSHEEIIKYLDESNDYVTHALGYSALNGLSSTFVERIEGSFNNLLYGLPLEVIPEMLKEVGYRGFYL